MTIFFVWTGDETLDVHSSGLGEFGPYQYQVYGTQLFGALQASSASARKDLDALHDFITVLPGVNGKLSSVQVSAILPTFPDAVVGGSMYDLLEVIYSATGMEFLNPDAY